MKQRKTVMLWTRDGKETNLNNSMGYNLIK